MTGVTGLAGRVCVVTGATRGAGLAIATELGANGATVYVTGRSTQAGGSTEGMAGTIEDAAAAVSAAGGFGVGVRVDHTVDSEVEALFARVRSDHGRLDLLVNNAWGGYEHHDLATFTAPFWDQPLSRWDSMFTAGVRAAIVSSRFAAPLMVERAGGLIVNTIAWAFGEYLGNLFYDTAKGAIVRMSFGMATELRPHGITAVALAPGFMRTERVMVAHAAQPFPLDGTESPAYLGRAVVALAMDADVLRRSGDVLTVGDLAREYGFRDLDGRQPEAFHL